MARVTVALFVAAAVLYSQYSGENVSAHTNSMDTLKLKPLYISPVVQTETVQSLRDFSRQLTCGRVVEMQQAMQQKAIEMGLGRDVVNCLSVDATGATKVDRMRYLGLNAQHGSWSVSCLGSGALKSTATRGTSSFTLQVDKGVDSTLMLFDCGEGTSKSIEHMRGMHHVNLRHIFITHLHGDHIFGLPTLILNVHGAQNVRGGMQEINIFGPQGLGSYIYSSLAVK